MIQDEITACRLCAERFRTTATAHAPRPVAWFAPGARVLVASQAPGLRVHGSGRPFTDASGRRLRDWMGVDEATFYDRSRVAIVPMAFCFPGYDAKGSDLPPPPLCAATWRARVLADLQPRVTLLIGGQRDEKLGIGKLAQDGGAGGVVRLVEGDRAQAVEGGRSGHSSSARVRRSSGTSSASNHGLRFSHPVLRQDG